MKLIIAVIKPDRLEAVKQELYKVDVNLITVSEVLGHGRQMGVTEVYRGVKEMGNLLKKDSAPHCGKRHLCRADDQGHYQRREDGRDRRRQDICAAPGGVRPHKNGGTGRAGHRLTPPHVALRPFAWCRGGMPQGRLPGDGISYLYTA